MRHRASLMLAVVVIAFVGDAAAADTPANTLTPAERAAGWRLLFDGTSLAGWRGYRKPDPTGTRWKVTDGALCIPHDDGSDTLGQRDIVSSDEFDTFDLDFEWKVGPGSNSGLKYFVTENRDAAIGHEYQIIDDERHEDAKVAGGERQTASFYDVKAASSHPTRPIGEWNRSRVLVTGNHVEHWLNGVKVLEYELGSPAMAAAVADSKFKGIAGFGTRVKGHILLQDHGEAVCFRNVKIRAK
jgi:3-keto-disaccharide hydrolase